MRILLVEDNDSSVDVLSRILVKVGHEQPTVAVNGMQTLQQMWTNTFDLYLIDFDFPDLHGTHIGLALRRTIMNKQIPIAPIVALTAQSDSDNQKEAVLSGMNAFVSKPCSTRDLNAAIEKLTRDTKN